MSAEIVRRIQRACAERYGVRPADMTGPRLRADFRGRQRIMSRALKAAIYLATTRTELPYEQLAEMFGYTNHSQISKMHGLAQWPPILAETEEIADQIGIGRATVIRKPGRRWPPRLCGCNSPPQANRSGIYSASDQAATR